MIENDVRLRLYDIIEQTGYINLAVSTTTFEKFMSDPLCSAAVIRFFEIIGEAVKHIPDDIRYEYPNIPWKKLAGFRDVLIHDYPKVDLELVWNFAVHQTPELTKKIEEILGNEL